MDPNRSGGELKERIVRIVKDEIAPALYLDAEGIEVLGVTDGVVQLRLSGACASCPSSLMTIIMGIEQELRQRIPEVEYLEAVP